MLEVVDLEYIRKKYYVEGWSSFSNELTVKALGYLDELIKEYDDPIAHY